MDFVLERITEPDIEPVTLVEAKRHIRQFEDITTEDDDVEALIQVAREWVEDYTGRAMIDQEWRLTVQQSVASSASGDSVSGSSAPGYYSGQTDWVKAGGVLLRRSPVIEVTRFVSIDALGVETAIDSGSYVLWNAGSKQPRISPTNGATWPSGTFRIEFRAGFANRLDSPVDTASVVPASLKHAIKLIIANYDQNREPVNVGNIVNELPLGLKWLLASQKCDLGMA